jgi:DNA polymerase II small subunit
MNTKEILKFCLEKGFLLDNEVFNLFNQTTDSESVKVIIGSLKDYTNQRVITRTLFSEHREKVLQIISTLPKESQEEFENLRIKLGLSIEISQEHKNIELRDAEVLGSVKVLSPTTAENSKKIEVGDFVRHFRNRVAEMSKILQGNSSLKNLVSVGKLSDSRQGVSVIGMISEKITTKNKNILLEVEDLTGKIKVLVNSTNKELCEKAEDICLDSVLGFSGFGNREILFANNIVFPECFLPERKKSSAEEYALFVGDIHLGSNLFLEKSFSRFIDYLGEKNQESEARKIKYLFINGDIVAGVGNYPSQERYLAVKDLEEQYLKLSEFLKKIRKDIKIIISPGNHDGVRLMEPQPMFNEKFAWSLYGLKNALILGNPNLVNIGAKPGFSGFDVLSYHGFSYPYYANVIPKLALEKALARSPDKVMHYLLMNRHLAPSHSSVQYFPGEEDELIIKKIPDIMVSGHTHKCAVSYYNNVLTLSTAAWEGKTDYEEKMGIEPDFCKVPAVNLKTRGVKILDFEEEEDKKRENG